MTIREIGISTSSKKNQLKISFWIELKLFREHKVSVFFSMVKQPSPKLVIKVLLGTNTKRNTKNTIITEL